jgi:N-acyl-D-aspartate/D-glutamate deacylase
MRLVWIFVLVSVLQARQYDLVIRNGHVMDPESNLDAIRNLGISDGKIQAISVAPLESGTVIDATGLVVAPGFIDLHSHGQDAENYRNEAMDGVTTALEMEVGVADVDAWYGARDGTAVINYGASVGHVPLRIRIMHDPGDFLPSGDAAHRSATEEEIADLRRRIERGLVRGAAGVGLGIQYTPAASPREIAEMFRAAARYHATCFVHLRTAGEGSVQALEEVVSDSSASGAPLHVVHISSSGLASTPRLLAMIAAARARTLDVTTELYPYNAAMTSIQSALFDPGWQQMLGIDYHDLQWTATGERLTTASFERYRKMGGAVILHMIPESAVLAALSSPSAMIASDGGLHDGKGHPRTTGTFARVLGHYVRQTHTLTLMEALRKMTLMPAQRLQDRVPMMLDKGRIRVGADADITVFNADTVADASTYEDPAKYSKGIQYVVVNGVPVVRDGALESITPGRAVRAPVR